MQGLPQSSFSLWFSCFSSSPSLSPCAAWVILFQQHPCLPACLPGRGMKPSDTNKTQTKTLDVPCAGPWARTHQTLLSLSVSPFSIHLLSLSFIQTHINSRVQTKSRQSAGLTTHSSSCQCYHTRLITWVESSGKTCGQIFRGFVEQTARSRAGYLTLQF